MAESLLPFAYLGDARVARHATGDVPAWLWHADGRRVLWANAAAVHALGTASLSDLTRRSFPADSVIAGQVADLADMLPGNGSPRLAMLDLSAEGCGGLRLCLCSRLQLCDGTAAILAIAAEAASAALPLAERVRRLLAETDAPAAAFAPDGHLIHATASARERMGHLTTLASLAADPLGSKALAEGHAEGRSALGRVRLDRLGRDGSAVLLMRFPIGADDPATESSPPAPPPPPTPSAPLEAAAEPRHPLRFVWQMDSDGRFTVPSEAFVALIGPGSAAMLGQPWIDLARKLHLDPGDQISHAVDSRETWSGIVIAWPVEGTKERLLVEMSGLPMFDRERTFLGYRGFGVCRDAERYMTATRPDATASIAQEPQPPDTTPADEVTPALSPIEHTAFAELARELNARLKGGQPQSQAVAPAPSLPPSVVETDDAPGATAATHDGARELMDRLPVGVLVYRFGMPIYANRAFLKWSGDASLDAFIASGGLDRLLLESDVSETREDTRTLTLTTGAGTGMAESRLFSINWEGERAHALVLVPIASAAPVDDADLKRMRRRVRELRAIVDFAANGVLLLDEDGAIVRLSHGAETLFGCTTDAARTLPFVDLLAPESRSAAAADFAALVRDADARHTAREVFSRPGRNGSVPLLMTLGCLAADKSIYCAVFRDISGWKRTEADLLGAKRQAEQASQAKSDFLAKISHEIRTPLNAIIGFSEVMMDERLGPIENERYRAYLKDIHASGEHLVALLNDLLDLSKIEAGKLELSFARVDLNALTQQCVALMQPQANRGRVIIRTSLAPGLPPIVADARSVRQILLNLLSNSIKFTGAGGQVIVSTALTDGNEGVLRVRDTGIGMTEKEIETALEPFRQIQTSARGGSGGTGLGLPLTKALAEANRANFAIKSSVESGTLVEVAFPTAQKAGG